MPTKAIKICPFCNICFTKQRSFCLHIRACRRSTEPETSTGISSLSANPLLSIADTSLAQRLSSNNTDFDNDTSQIEPSDDVFDNADNSSDDADVPVVPESVNELSKKERVVLEYFIALIRL